MRRPRRVALVGNPNVGKSSLFNALTGLHQKVSNYPGTTVERIVGTFRVQGGTIDLVDLPGTYSLLPRSPDEAVVRDALLGHVQGDPIPEVLILVLDATNIERNLLLASQAFELGRPCVAALNQCDLALEAGLHLDAVLLSQRLGIDVIPTCGRTGQGRDALAAAVAAGGKRPKPLALDLPPAAVAEAAELADVVGDLRGSLHAGPGGIARALVSEAAADDLLQLLGRTGRAAAAGRVRESRARLAASGVDVAAALATARYAAIARVLDGAVVADATKGGWRRTLDHLLLHPVSGSIALVAIFAVVFVAIFSWAQVIVDPLSSGLDAVGSWAFDVSGGGLFGDFLRAGVVAGMGNFLVFVPQIAIFFVMLEMLDDTGYLARAAFLLDKTMGRFGLPGRAFLPMLSGFACAIPGIMSTRTMSNFRDRLVAMAVMPLMSCSARMPVYLLVVAVAFAGASWWVGPAVVISMYLLGIGVALVASSALRRTVLKGGRTPLLLELPPYRVPVFRNVGRNVARRTWAFVSGAGPTIFVLSLGLWTLLTFPRDVTLSRDFAAEAKPLESAVAAAVERNAPAEEIDRLTHELAALGNLESAERREQSYLGRLGKGIEPALKPLGFDWKIGVGILGSFAAREVFVSTLGVIYAAGEDVDEESADLQDRLRGERWPDGRAVYSPLAGISLCVFYILAMQCMSTLAVLKRETGGWKWPAGIFGAMTVLAYVASLVVYQTGLLLGF
ncbi:MAG: ferrous iron transport protein B [Planctomycetes bacterium]|nr:ferrous iron transport protein B [Planctomycetota bacterium]